MQASVGIKLALLVPTAAKNTSMSVPARIEMNKAYPLGQNVDAWDDVIAGNTLQDARGAVQTPHGGGYRGNVEANQEQDPHHGHLQTHHMSETMPTNYINSTPKESYRSHNNRMQFYTFLLIVSIYIHI